MSSHLCLSGHNFKERIDGVWACVRCGERRTAQGKPLEAETGPGGPGKASRP